MPESADNLHDIREVRRRDLHVRVRFCTADGDRSEGLLSSVGEHGLFIEHQHPLPVGTELELEFVPPDGSSERLEVKGVVAWICPRPDQYAFSRGMGVRLTEVLKSGGLKKALERAPTSEPATFSHLLMLYARTLQGR
jgi:Tfp pilus assembly protein PilZ